MKVINTHRRTLKVPLNEVADILKTLSSAEDKIWPHENWPPMKFKDGIKKGAIGGHGPIKYQVDYFEPTKLIKFRFMKPEGFDGIHKLETKELTQKSTELIHTIEMKTRGFATIKWILFVRVLHDALLEDALDKVENQLMGSKKRSEWSPLVKFIRKQFVRNASISK